MKRKLTIVTSAILTVYTSFTLVDTFMLQHSGTACDEHTNRQENGEERFKHGQKDGHVL